MYELHPRHHEFETNKKSTFNTGKETSNNDCVNFRSSEKEGE